MTIKTQSGQCLCGAVRVSARGVPVNVRVCHCRLCQKAMGGPFLARALFKQSQVDMSGDFTTHKSSEFVERLACKTCGSPLGARPIDKSHIAIALAVFDNRNVFEPTEHIWVSEKMQWVKLIDDLPQYPKGC